MRYSPVDIARQFLHVREAQTLGQNQGRRVNGIQMYSGGPDAIGTSWCAWFAIGLVLDICFEGVSPFPRDAGIDGSTVEALAYARRQGWITISPSVGDLVFSVRADGTPHHVAIVTAGTPLTAIAGNTSEDGVSSNGDRVAEHVISADGKVFVAYPR